MATALEWAGATLRRCFVLCAGLLALSAPAEARDVLPKEFLGPDVLFVAEQNLTKSLARLLVGQNIANGGKTVALISDQIYCPPDNKGNAIILLQLTNPSATTYAPYLQTSDCNLSVTQIFANNAHKAGFAGVIDLQVTWNNWSITTKQNGLLLNPFAGFSIDDLTTIQNFAINEKTSGILAQSGGDQLTYSFALKFHPNAISVGLFSSIVQYNAADWFEAPRLPDTSDITTNSFVSLKMAFLNQLSTEFPDIFSYTIPGTGITISHFGFGSGEISHVPIENGAVISASAPVSGNATIVMDTFWRGNPLTFAKALAQVTPAQPIWGNAFAQLISNALKQHLVNSVVLPSLQRSVTLKLGNLPASYFFYAKNSSWAPGYLLFSGNGGLQLGH